MPKLTGCHRIEVRARKLRSFCDSSFGDKKIWMKKNRQLQQTSFFINIRKVFTRFPPMTLRATCVLTILFGLRSGFERPQQVERLWGVVRNSFMAGSIAISENRNVYFWETLEAEKGWEVVINLIFLHWFMTSLLRPRRSTWKFSK